MGVPATTGKLCTNLADMEIGDYIACKYYAPTANTAGIFSDFGGSGTELSITPGTTANGYFYFLKAAKGLCIADRLVQTNISYNSLIKENYRMGKNIEECKLIRIISLSEFTKYITNGNLAGCIKKQDVNVWHGTVGSYTERTIKGTLHSYTEYVQEISKNSVRTILYMNGSIGYYDNGSWHYYPAFYGSDAKGMPVWYAFNSTGLNIVTQYANCTSHHSFRPVLEFVDNKKSTNIWY